MYTERDIIDFHAHVLPCADHGSDSVDTTVFQLSSAAAAGVRCIIAPPHFYPTCHSVESFLARRDEAYENLRPRLTPDMPEIILGAEVLMCHGIERLDGLSSLCVAGTRVLLLELPYSDFSESYVQSVRNLTKDGYEVVLAHAERYHPENIEEMVRAGAKIQLNAGALSGLFVDRTVSSWVDRGIVVALGSDIHMRDPSAYKRFVKARARLGKVSDNVAAFGNRVLNTAATIEDNKRTE